MLKRVLCLHENYIGYTSSNNISACNYIIYRTVEASGLCKDIKVFYYDLLAEIGVNGMAKSLLEEVKAYQPELIIFFVPFEILSPFGNTLQFIRKHYPTKIIAFCTDLIMGLASAGKHEVFKYYSKLADALVSVDSTCTRVFYDNPCIIQGHPTIDLNLFQPLPGTVKDIDVSFIGSLMSGIYDSRRRYLEYIKPKIEEQGYSLFVGGGLYKGLGEKILTLEDYKNIMNRSKIVLNFSLSFAAYRQMKGRIMEAMACKSFVMTENCPNIGKFFDQDVDYVSFDSNQELLEKLLYYLEYEEQREKIAKSAFNKMVEIYKPKNVWGYIFKKLGFDVVEIEDANYKIYEGKMNAVQNSVDITYPSLHETDYITNKISQKEYKLAINLILVRLQVFPVDQQNWYLLGKCLYNLNLYQEAEMAFTRWKFLDPFAKPQQELVLDPLNISKNNDVCFDIKKYLEPSCSASVTAVIVTKDNALTIEVCIESLQKAVDKIVIVDVGSQDETKEIVKEFVKRYPHISLLEQNPDKYEEALLLGVQNSVEQMHSWIFYINPDEYLFTEDIPNIKLAASLFSEQDTLLNIISQPVMPLGIENNLIIEQNRLFPRKVGVLLNNYGIRISENAGMISRTIRIRIHYNFLQRPQNGRS